MTPIQNWFWTCADAKNPRHQQAFEELKLIEHQVTLGWMFERKVQSIFSKHGISWKTA